MSVRAARVHTLAAVRGGEVPLECGECFHDLLAGDAHRGVMVLCAVSGSKSRCAGAVPCVVARCAGVAGVRPSK